MQGEKDPQAFTIVERYEGESSQKWVSNMLICVLYQGKKAKLIVIDRG